MSEDNMSQLMNTLKTMLNNNSTSANTSDSSASNTSADGDVSSSNSNLESAISPEMISNMAKLLKNSSNNNAESSNNNQVESSNSSLDLETIMKIKSIMEMLNKKDDPRSNLLYSLKPYLRKSRQEKLEQYTNLFKITQVANIFNFKKGDSK